MEMLRNRLKAIVAAWNSFEVPFWIFIFMLLRVLLTGTAFVIAFMLPILTAWQYFVK